MDSCPWSLWQPATLTFCERVQCAFITQPANTWSNLAYIAVGIYTLIISRKENAPKLSYIGVMAILVGIGSFFFHASSTFVGEVADVGAMFLFANYMLVCNLRRLKGHSWRDMGKLYFFLMALSLALLVSLRWVGILVFTILVTTAGLLELAIFFRDSKRITYRPLLALIGLFSLAFVIWVLDKRGIVCDPDNHVLQGHAAWHLINSLCFYYLYRFYKPMTERGLL